MKSVGKLVRGDYYFHESAAGEVSSPDKALMEEALKISGLNRSEDFNVVKIARGRLKVSLLFYIDFNGDPFPKLGDVCTVDIKSYSCHYRSYRPDGNPPILHKKELLLSRSHESRPMFEGLTESLEALGIRPTQPGSGFKRQWEEYLAQKKVIIQDHKLQEFSIDRD